METNETFKQSIEVRNASICYGLSKKQGHNVGKSTECFKKDDDDGWNEDEVMDFHSPVSLQIEETAQFCTVALQITEEVLSQTPVSSLIKEDEVCNAKCHFLGKPCRSPSKPIPDRIKFPDKSKLPPLRGLLKNNKTIIDEPWQDIERSNLAYVSTSGSNNEFYICYTNIEAIRKSLKDSMLEVSRKNMENIASLGRGRKFLILRAEIRNAKTPVVIGIAMVNTNARLGKGKKQDDCYFAKVTYLCLSVTFLPGNILGSTQHDGTEIFSHISNNFIQLYMLALRQKKVKPLFPHIFPWNSRFIPSFDEHDSARSTELVKVKEHCDSPVSIKSNIDYSGLYSDDILQHSCREEVNISFQQIKEELSCIHDKSSEEITPFTPYKSTKGITKEAVEKKLKMYSSEFTNFVKSECLPQKGVFFSNSRNSNGGFLKEGRGKVNQPLSVTLFNNTEMTSVGLSIMEKCGSGYKQQNPVFFNNPESSRDVLLRQNCNNKVIRGRGRGTILSLQANKLS